jgi:predicted Holliday junction resolvase-like endonuclease
MPTIEEVIEQLKASGLYAECSCGGEFKLSEVILFDGTKPFPKEALGLKQQLEEGLDERAVELQKRMKRAKTHVRTTTTAVNIGFHLEKMLLTLKNFNWEIPDCRFIANPIDFLAFKGMSKNKISAIDFVEVKSGAARLNEHQKMIKDALEDKKLKYKEFA